MQRLRSALRQSGVRLALVVALLGSTVFIALPSAGNLAARHDPGGRADLPVQILAGTTCIAVLLIAAATAWISRGKPGLSPRGAALLAAGLALITIKVIGVDIAQVWSTDHVYDAGTSLSAGTYSAHAWQIYRDGGGITQGAIFSIGPSNQVWTPGTSTQTWMLYGAVGFSLFALLPLAAIRRPKSTGFEHGPRHRLLKAPVGSAETAVAVVLAATALILMSLVLIGRAADTEAANDMTLLAAVLIAGSVVAEIASARPGDHSPSSLLAAGMGGSFLVLLSCAWLPLVYLYNAVWPLRITAITLGAGGGSGIGGK